MGGDFKVIEEKYMNARTADPKPASLREANLEETTKNYLREIYREAEEVVYGPTYEQGREQGRREARGEAQAEVPEVPEGLREI